LPLLLLVVAGDEIATLCTGVVLFLETQH